jgi:hypothetical protein
MFEYTTKNNKKVTINPKMITVIMEGENSDETLIYTADSPDPIRVVETYENVNKSFQRFNYSVNTVITM